MSVQKRNLCWTGRYVASPDWLTCQLDFPTCRLSESSGASVDSPVFSIFPTLVFFFFFLSLISSSALRRSQMFARLSCTRARDRRLSQLHKHEQLRRVYIVSTKKNPGSLVGERRKKKKESVLFSLLKEKPSQVNNATESF